METLNPPVLWAQRRDRLMVSINVPDIRDEKFSVDGQAIVFSGVDGFGRKYSCTLTFFGEIVPEESKHKKSARELYFSLKKKEAGPYWSRLLKEAAKVPFVKVDFNRWKDEDESDEEDDQFDDGLQNLMQKMDMGGAAAGNGMFDPEEPEEDSDDEDIPNLDET
jgi:prostaglandin-E synthase